MKLSPRLKKSIRIAAPVLLALLLSIAILPGAAFAQGPSGTPGSPGGLPGGSPGGTPGGTQGTPSGDPPTETPPLTPPETDPPETDPPETDPPETDPPETDPPATTPPATTPPVMNPQPHASAPFTPPADCIVAHAATPAQICPIGGGLQYYFIGPGSSQPGPWIQPFSELATLHAGGASIYSGTNPSPASRSRSTTCLPTRRFGSAPSTPITSTTPTSPTTSPSMPTTRCPMKPGNNKAHTRLLHETRS